MNKKFRYSTRFLLLLVFIVSLFGWWFNGQRHRQASDANNVDYFDSASDTPLPNAQFRFGYVFISENLARLLGSVGAPFERVVEIDFRLDNFRSNEDIEPYLVFEDVTVIRLDSLPESKKALTTLKRFSNLEHVFVSRGSAEEIDAAAKLLAPIDVSNKR